jgi:hypothetical protein
MLELLLGTSGGFLGVLGALFKHGLEIYQEKKREDAALSVLIEKNKHELLMTDKEIAIITLEAKNANVLAELNASKEIEVSSYNAMAKSYDADKATYSNAPTSKWMIAVDFVRGMTRPALTLYYAIMLSVFTFCIWSYIPVSVMNDPLFLKETFYRLVDALIFVTTTCVLWWFAARQLNTKVN